MPLCFSARFSNACTNRTVRQPHFGYCPEIRSSATHTRVSRRASCRAVGGAQQGTSTSQGPDADTQRRLASLGSVVTDAAVPEGHKGLHGFLYGEGGAEAHDSTGYSFRNVRKYPTPSSHLLLERTIHYNSMNCR